MAIFSLLSVVLALLVGQQCDAMFGMKSKVSITILDEGDEDLKFSKAILDQICDYRRSNSRVVYHFSKVSSIEWLNENFVDLSKIPSLGSEHIRCLADYGQPLSELTTIIDSLDPDACGSLHIDLIQHFHNKYLEPSLISRKLPKGQAELPDPLKWFFIHYAFELSQICHRNLVKNLDLMGKSSNAQNDAIVGGIDGRFFHVLENLFKSPEDGEKQTSFGLIWNMIERLGRKYNGRSVVGDWNRLTGDTIRLRLMIKAAGPIRSTQEKCRNQLRPIYSETALSAMRLIDMGYTTTTPDSQANKQAQNWFGIVQTCEYLLGIETYQNPSLDPEEVRVLSWEDTIALYEQKDQTIFDPITFEKLPANPFNDLMAYLSIEENPNKLLKLMKNDVATRIKRFQRMIRKSVLADRKALIKNLKFPSKSKLGKGTTWAEGALEESVDWPMDQSIYNYGDEGEGRQQQVAVKKQTFSEWMAESTNEHPFFWFYVAPAMSFIFIICLIGLIG